MKDVRDALKAYIDQYGEGAHKSKSLIEFTEARGVKWIYYTLSRYAQRGARGEFVIDKALLAKFDKVVAAKDKRHNEAAKKAEVRVADRAEKAKAKAAAKAAKEAEKAKLKEAKQVERGYAKLVKQKAKLMPTIEGMLAAGGAIVNVESLETFGFVKATQAQARAAREAGKAVLVVDSAVSDTVATPPLQSDLVLASDSVTFYTVKG